jgi:hypothetical protein
MKIYKFWRKMYAVNVAGRERNYSKIIYKTFFGKTKDMRSLGNIGITQGMNTL